MFIPGGCFCCDPPEDPCVLSGCTWTSTDMSDTDLTAGTAYYNPVSGTTPDGSYEITNAQETGTGNDAPCRKITIETVEAPQKPDTVYAICWKDNATHNPSTQCPLTSVSFCVESKRHGDSDSGLTDSVVFVVRQNNRIFATTAQPVGVNWKRASGTYTQGSFTEIDGAGNPDFTAAGTSIEFGFALKLLVSEDEEPLDVVMFDNLCITRVTGCANSCLNGECDYTNDGSSLTVRKTSSGINYSVSSADGLPADSHRITFNVFNPSNERARLVCDSSLQDILDLSGADCLSMTSVLICFNFKVNSVVPGGGFYIWADVKPDEVPSGSNTPPAGTPIWNSTTGFGIWRKTTGGGTVSSAMQASLSDYYPVIEISGNGQFDVSIDNICVKAVYGNACNIDTQLSFSNPSLLRSYSGGDASITAARSWVTSSLNATYILSNPCLSQVLDSEVFGNYRYTLSWIPWVSVNLGPTYVNLVVNKVSGPGGPFNIGLSNVFTTSTSVLGFNECVSSNTVNRSGYNPGTQFTLPTPADEVWFSVDSFTVSRPVI